MSIQNKGTDTLMKDCEGKYIKVGDTVEYSKGKTRVLGTVKYRPETGSFVVNDFSVWGCGSTLKVVDNADSKA